MIRLLLNAILLQFVKAVHSGDFQAYVSVLTVLSYWTFSINHYNYARWLPIHIRTMLNFKEMFSHHSWKESLQCRRPSFKYLP